MKNLYNLGRQAKRFPKIVLCKSPLMSRYSLTVLAVTKMATIAGDEGGIPVLAIVLVPTALLGLVIVIRCDD
jgi:hypothetical protein